MTTKLPQVLTVKILEAKHEAKLESWQDRGCKTKNLRWGEYGYFQELHNIRLMYRPVHLSNLDSVHSIAYCYTSDVNAVTCVLAFTTCIDVLSVYKHLVNIHTCTCMQCMYDLRCICEQNPSNYY